MAVEKIFLISKFNDELISSFIEFLNDSEGSKHLVMDSVGGNLDAMNLILSIVNDNPDQYRITAYGTIASAAFDFLLLAKCKKVVLDSATGVIHLSGRDLHTRDSKNIHSFDYWVKELEEESHNESIIFYSEYLTLEELELVKGGKEIFLTSKRLRTIIDKNVK